MKQHILSLLGLLLTSICTATELPIQIEPHHKYKVTSEQVQHIQEIAGEMVAPDELDQATILIRNHHHPGVNYYARINLPRQVGQSRQFAIHRSIHVYCSHWPNRHFHDYPNAPPEEALQKPPQWHTERSFWLTPLFIINGKEYEVGHDENELNRFAIYDILKAIDDGNVVYQLKDGKEPKTMLTVEMVSSIMKRDENTLFIMCTDPKKRFRGPAYRGRMEDGKLIITVATRWIS
jgi:hypothetical protein